MPRVAGIPDRVRRAIGRRPMPRCAVISIAFQRTISPGPRHWFVLGSRTRPLPHPPSRCSCPMPCVAEGIEVVAGVEGAVAAPTVAGGFRIGAPAAIAVAGIASITAIAVTAIESRRPICVLPRRQSTYYNDDGRSVQPRPRAAADFRPHSGVMLTVARFGHAAVMGSRYTPMIPGGRRPPCQRDTRPPCRTWADMRKVNSARSGSPWSSPPPTSRSQFEVAIPR